MSVALEKFGQYLKNKRIKIISDCFQHWSPEEVKELNIPSLLHQIGTIIQYEIIPRANPSIFFYIKLDNNSLKSMRDDNLFVVYRDDFEILL